MARADHVRVNANEEALRFKCPECGASSGVVCTYMADSFKIRTEYDLVIGHRVDVRVQTQVKGAPTKRPHNGRLAKVWEAKRDAERAAWYAQREHEQRDRFADARRTYTDFGNREQQDLKLWLHKYGSILWQT